MDTVGTNTSNNNIGKRLPTDSCTESRQPKQARMEQNRIPQTVVSQSSTKEAYTITFGDRAENGTYMRKIGTAVPRGLAVKVLHTFARELPMSKVFDLTKVLGDNFFTANNIQEQTHQAAILVVRDGVRSLGGCSAEDVLAELRKMPKDGKKLTQDGKVTTNSGRSNNCMGDRPRKPDIANGFGTVVCFDAYPHVSALRNALNKLVDWPLVGELNHYFNTEQCGIGWHGDGERKIVVGARFGPGTNDMPLKIQWYHYGAPVGPEVRIELGPGDLYFLSQKAVGYDKSAPLKLKHATGNNWVRTKSPLGDKHPVINVARPLTVEQSERVEANRQRALAIRAAKITSTST